MISVNVAYWIKDFIGCVEVDPAMGYPGVYAVTALGRSSKPDQCLLRTLAPSKGAPPTFWIANVFLFETEASRKISRYLEAAKNDAILQAKVAGAVGLHSSQRKPDGKLENKALTKTKSSLTPEQRRAVKRAFYGEAYSVIAPRNRVTGIA